MVSAAIPAQAAAQPPGPASSWRLLFQDGFNDNTLNTNRWATRYARGGDMANSNIPNGELQWYKRRNVVEGGGVLRLIAKRERTVSPNTGQVFNYSSGMITSKPSLNFRYGYLEARVTGRPLVTATPAVPDSTRAPQPVPAGGLRRDENGIWRRVP